MALIAGARRTVPRRVGLWVCAAWAAFAACADGRSAQPAGAASAAAVTTLVGEIRLHQFPSGAHASVIARAEPVALAGLMGAEPFTAPRVPALREGPCLLYLEPRCVSGCDAGRRCVADETCAAPVAERNLDIGEIRVTGSTLAPLIRLWFLAPDLGYGADPPPGLAPLFAGGEALLVAGGRGPYALVTRLRAPLPVEVLEPPPAAPLHLPQDGPLVLRWRPGGGAQVLALITASAQGARGGLIRCLVPDSGQVSVAARLLAALPPPPRAVRYELERDEEVLVPVALGGGAGLLVHAAYSAWVNGADP